MASRKSSRSKSGKAKVQKRAGKAAARGKAAKAKAVSVSAKKAPQQPAHKLAPPFSHLHALHPLPEHIIKLLIPTSGPLPLPPSAGSSSPAGSSSQNQMSDEQTWQLLSLGQKCYSLMGQTRLFWSHLQPPFADHEWLRFHFLQSSMLSSLFIAFYALIGGAVVLDLLGAGLMPFGVAEFALGAMMVLHFALFFTLGKKASRGEVPMLPLIGPHAAMLAAQGRPLQEWKL